MKLFFSAIALFFCMSAAFAAPDLKVEVDAREISRALLHARIEIPAAPGPLVVWYPKWIPGVHAPAGPVANLAGLTFETAKGEPIAWRRDEEELARFHLTVPPGATQVVAKLDYICNQPNTNSTGVDSYGNSLLGVINWNTVLLYPESATIDDAKATVRLTLPAGWRFGTALKAEPAVAATPQEQPYTVSFRAETLRRVVDCPLICGENFRTIELTGKNTPPTFLHLTSEAASGIAIDDKLIGRYRALVAEALTLFGSAPFSDYHFLVVCSDQLPTMGLEHLMSSLNGVGERELVDEKKRKAWPAYLLPHEFVHAWCGKFRRPASMVTPNFHTPERTRLLWVYEGLTQYLGEVLTVRSSLLKLDDYLPALGAKVEYLNNQAGRRWRSLEDTAVAAWHLRAKSPAWANLRRSQDYYDEGLVTWMEVDAIIREQSGDQRSLDDFCKTFFAAKDAKPPVVGYELAEIIGILKGLADYDWEKHFKERISTPNPALSLKFLERAGYRVQFTPKQSEYLADREKDRKNVSVTASLGLVINEDGRIATVIPGSVADRAGVASAQTVTGVNGRKFTPQRLKDAITDSPTQRHVELLILDGDAFKTVKLEYAEGPKYFEITRATDKPDVLAAILKSKLEPEKKEDAK